MVFLNFCLVVIYPSSSQCLPQQSSVFLLQQEFFPLVFPFLLQSFPSNVWCDPASTFHFLEICLLHCTLEAFLQKKPQLFYCPSHVQMFLFFWPSWDSLSTKCLLWAVDRANLQLSDFHDALQLLFSPAECHTLPCSAARQHWKNTEIPFRILPAKFLLHGCTSHLSFLLTCWKKNKI